MVTGLWDSWADDAFVRDVGGGQFFDPAKLHVLNHRGPQLSVRGPLNIARPVQGWPVIVQAGASEPGRQLAAETAEVVFAAPGTLENGRRFYADVKGRMDKLGRNREHLKILPGAFVVVADTVDEARAIRARLDSLVHADSAIASLSIALGHDASKFDPDAPLPEVPPTNASQTSRERAIELARRENLTVRQLAQRLGGYSGLAFVGTPQTIADDMQQWLETEGSDGFNVMFPLAAWRAGRVCGQSGARAAAPGHLPPRVRGPHAARQPGPAQVGQPVFRAHTSHCLAGYTAFVPAAQPLPPMLPLIDVAALTAGPAERAAVARQIGDACRAHGFFYVIGHGISPALVARLEALSHRFFALPEATKMQWRMALGGRAWRGYFPLGGELTSGRPDWKEGLYLGTELAPDHPLVQARTPLHGPNLLPELDGFADTILAYMDAVTALGHRLMEGIALSLALPASYFADRYTADPLVLFRLFNYPTQPLPAHLEQQDAQIWGVGEHTDYGLLTILHQDDVGGLSVHTPAGWVDAPPVPGSFVCNIGDMLDHMTGGLYKSTPHRVKRNTSGRDRLSFPLFFDPNFAARVQRIEGLSSAHGHRRQRQPLGPRQCARVPRPVWRLPAGQGVEGVPPSWWPMCCEASHQRSRNHRTSRSPPNCTTRHQRGSAPRSRSP